MEILNTNHNLGVPANYKTRRKKIFWYDKLSFLKKKKITITRLIFKQIKEPDHIYMISYLFSNALNSSNINVINENIDTSKETRKKNEWFLPYCNFINKNDKNFSFNKLVTSKGILDTHNYTNNFLILKTPKKQLFGVVTVNKTITITSGLIRLAMGFELKALKKKTLIKTNLIKFVVLILKNLISNKNYQLKIVKVLFLLPKVVTQIYNSNIQNALTHILYLPKISFSPIKCRKRGALKKKLRKRKKYISY